MFNVVPGLDGKPGSVSLELGSKPGCFLIAGTSAKVQVGCRSRGGDGFATCQHFEPNRLMAYLSIDMFVFFSYPLDNLSLTMKYGGGRAADVGDSGSRAAAEAKDDDGHRVTGAAAARPHGGGEVGGDCAAGDRGSDGRVARLRRKTAATVRHTSEDGDGQATRRKRKTVTAVQWTTGTVAASPLN
uniref:Uncharacterized protein n=1 Tax=Oryza nivara TaxID=4536 RepID=A0A0E0HTK9_ORYNI